MRTRREKEDKKKGLDRKREEKRAREMAIAKKFAEKNEKLRQEIELKVKERKRYERHQEKKKGSR